MPETFTPEQLEDLKAKLQEKFSAAGITLSVGGRVAILLDESNEALLGRFLKANPTITTAILFALWEHLGSPNKEGISAAQISSGAVVPIPVKRR